MSEENKEQPLDERDQNMADGLKALDSFDKEVMETLSEVEAQTSELTTTPEDVQRELLNLLFSDVSEEEVNQQGIATNEGKEQVDKLTTVKEKAPEAPDGPSEPKTPKGKKGGKGKKKAKAWKHLPAEFVDLAQRKLTQVIDELANIVCTEIKGVPIESYERSDYVKDIREVFNHMTQSKQQRQEHAEYMETKFGPRPAPKKGKQNKK